MRKVFIYPVNPEKSYSDLQELEKVKNVEWEAQGKRGSWREGDIFLIYVSKDPQEIQYICKVVNVYDDGWVFELQLLHKIRKEISSLLKYDVLKKNGLNSQFQSFNILNNNPKLCSYISNILLENNYIDEPFCEGRDINLYEKKEEKMGKIDVEECIEILKIYKQIILQGAPGTGKTHLARKIANELANDEDNIKFVQFHPSYGYEDFVRGIVAEEKNGNIKYEVKDKVLAKIAKEAYENEEENYVLIIDEINRANLSSVLGELIYALEYRGERVEDMYGKEIILPENLYIIATMNTADRSVGNIDYAIRRRFIFIDMIPYEEDMKKFIEFVKEDIKDERAKELFEDVAEIFKNYLFSEFDKRDVIIGYSYFIQTDREKDNNLWLEDKLEYQIKPLLMEYIKDGVLRSGAEKEINDLEVKNGDYSH